MDKKSISLIITDVDNTLYDWVQIWFSSFNAMLKELVIQSDIDQSILEAEIQSIFQKYGTSEYAFVIQELPSLRKKYPGENLAIRFDDVIQVRDAARARALKLYPGVLDALQILKGKGCLIIAFTESMEYYIMRRLKSLGLDGVIDYLYSLPDHPIPSGIEIDKIRQHPEDHYKLQKTVHRLLPKTKRKPDPDVLLEIIHDDGINTDVDEVIYIGDSLLKDILMAQNAYVTDVYAKYGVAQQTDAYDLLRKVTHWTKEDVERERAFHSDRDITPTYVLEKSFYEVLELFNFIPHRTI